MNDITFSELLIEVPNTQIVRIDALISSLRTQRDSAQNSAATISAELEVCRAAVDHYHQMSLGLSAQLTVIKNEHTKVIENKDTEIAHLTSTVELLNEELRALKLRIANCESLHELRCKTDTETIPEQLKLDQ